jgi:hypothetical protein
MDSRDPLLLLVPRIFPIKNSMEYNSSRSKQDFLFEGVSLLMQLFGDTNQHGNPQAHDCLIFYDKAHREKQAARQRYRESYYLLELIFNESMGGFHIGLPGMGVWWDGGVDDTVKGMNGFSKTGVVFGVPASYEFRSIVCLGAGSFNMHLAGLQMVQDDFAVYGAETDGALQS